MAEMEERIRQLEQRLAQAEARIAQLEAKPYPNTPVVGDFKWNPNTAAVLSPWTGRYAGTGDPTQ